MSLIMDVCDIITGETTSFNLLLHSGHDHSHKIEEEGGRTFTLHFSAIITSWSPRTLNEFRWMTMKWKIDNYVCTCDCSKF